MNSWQITHYSIGWNHAENRGFVTISLHGEAAMELNIESGHELAALAAVLREAPVFYREDGYIYSGWEASVPD